MRNIAIALLATSLLFGCKDEQQDASTDTQTSTPAAATNSADAPQGEPTDPPAAGGIDPDGPNAPRACETVDCACGFFPPEQREICGQAWEAGCFTDTPDTAFDCGPYGAAMDAKGRVPADEIVVPPDARPEGSGPPPPDPDRPAAK